LKYILLSCLIILFGTTTFGQKHLTKYDDTFKKYSKRFFGPGFDWRLFKAQGIAESQLSPNAMSRVGARGIMQLMPSTFKEIKSKNPDFTSVDDPEWNIGSGIYYDRTLYMSWKEIEGEAEKLSFTFGSYNAGRGTILKAQSKAKTDSLDHTSWESISDVAHKVPKWRYKETLNYVERINQYHQEVSK
jgi:membrane-bound lytic murein transglycosylase F